MHYNHKQLIRYQLIQLSNINWENDPRKSAQTLSNSTVNFALSYWTFRQTFVFFIGFSFGMSHTRVHHDSPCLILVHFDNKFCAIVCRLLFCFNYFCLDFLFFLLLLFCFEKCYAVWHWPRNGKIKTYQLSRRAIVIAWDFNIEIFGVYVIATTYFTIFQKIFEN